MASVQTSAQTDVKAVTKDGTSRRGRKEWRMIALLDELQGTSFDLSGDPVPEGIEQIDCDDLQQNDSLLHSYHQLFKLCFETEDRPFDLATVRRDYDETTSQHGQIMYLLEDGQMVVSGMRTYPVNGEVRIDNIMTRPGFERRGYGRRIVQAIMGSIWRDGNIDTVHLRCDKEGTEYTFYEKFGFYIADRDYVEANMRRLLYEEIRSQVEKDIEEAKKAV